MRTPVFDVTVTAQRHTAYTKLAQNELALQFFQLGFFRPEMEQQALACLDMMDFDGKQQILQKFRSGADAAAWQRMALTLADGMSRSCTSGWQDSLAGGSGTVRTAKKAGRGTGQSAAGAKARRRGGAARMIEVWLDKTALTVRGHAGFSRNGSDIVCAAASMLAFALAEAVQAAGMKNAAGDRIGLRTLPAGGVRGQTGAGAAGRDV